MLREFTPASSVANFRKEAKRWLKDLRCGDPDARARFAQAHPSAAGDVTLRDVQYALAREHGLEGWSALLRAVEQNALDAASPLHRLSVADYERLVHDMVAIYDARDEAALERVNRAYDRSLTLDDFAREIWRRNYAFRQRSSRVPKNYFALGEAQLMLAQDVGYGSWEALIAARTTGARPVPAHAIDDNSNRITPRRLLSTREWDALIATAKERRLTAIDAQGLMTDAVIARVAALDHVVSLHLEGSRELTDEGVRHLARMPQLQRLDLTGCKVSDRGLAVLRELPALKRFKINWHSGISDAGLAHLTFCEALEDVDLMGSSVGDGTINAIQGRRHLRSLKTGRLVTDAGLALLRNFPTMKTWHGGAELLIDGPFTNTGLAMLAGLEGIGALDLFWHVTVVTTDAFVHLAQLPNLMALGADGHLSDNTAMRHFAAIPRLKKLRAQECAADDDGFESLAASQTLESFWGRSSAGFGSRGFIAFSKMPSLRGFGVSCKNVDDRALSTLPSFPALCELTPIDFQDSGFVHIGRCERIERLTCMYCRETGDAATAAIERLPLKYYYAGLTKITDRSLESLGKIATLEQVDLYEVNGVTDIGLPFLARLPNLREVHLDTLPGVTLKGTRVFPKSVRVHYST